VVLQLSSKITYRLWVADGSDGVNEWSRNYPARSRTDCGSPMGVTESTSGFATIRQDHVQTVGRRWE
jgi:hypothetical protein